MKTKITALALLAAAAASVVPTPAKAGHDDGLAIAGGILGGVIIASAIANSHHDAYVALAPAYCPPPAPAPVYCPPPTPVYYGNDGCWQNVSVQVWVPGCWVDARDYRGYSTRRYVAPHYETRNNRVWVANNRGGNRNDHNDRNGRYTYNDRNDHRDHDNRGGNSYRR